MTGCGKTNNLPDTAKQNAYANVADCRRDWGNEKDCNPAPGGRGGGVVYLGPRYYWDRGTGRAMVIENGAARPAASGEASRGAPTHATSVESVAVARGGFGATAHGGGGESGGG
jgi:hypothetical protein